MTISKIFTIAAVGFSLAIGTAAQAEEAQDFRFRTGDIDLTNPAAVARLQDRLENAARDFCRTKGVVSLEERNQSRACTKEVIADASAQLETQRLAALGRRTETTVAMNVATPVRGVYVHE